MGYFVLESGAPFLLEDGTNLLLGDDCVGIPIFGSVLLLENGAFFLLEDGTNLLLEPCGPVPPPPSSTKKGRQNPQYRRISNEAMEEEDVELILTLWLAVKDSSGRRPHRVV